MATKNDATIPNGDPTPIIPNIFQKMLMATAKIATVAKNLQVDTGAGRGYKAVSEADVLAAVKPIETELGIYSYPVSRRIVNSGEIITTKEYKGTVTENKRLFLRVETVYRFVNAAKPEEYLDITTYGDGVDTQDKAPGKAMTYGDKYALLKAYKIRTGEDPDAEGSEDLGGIQLREMPASQKLITETEQMTLEAMCMKRGLDPAVVFNNWPDLSQEQYIAAVNKLNTIKEKAKA